MSIVDLHLIFTGICVWVKVICIWRFGWKFFADVLIVLLHFLFCLDDKKWQNGVIISDSVWIWCTKITLVEDHFHSLLCLNLIFLATMIFICICISYTMSKWYTNTIQIQWNKLINRMRYRGGKGILSFLTTFDFLGFDTTEYSASSSESLGKTYSHKRSHVITYHLGSFYMQNWILTFFYSQRTQKRSWENHFPCFHHVLWLGFVQGQPEQMQRELVNECRVATESVHSCLTWRIINNYTDRYILTVRDSISIRLD